MTDTLTERSPEQRALRVSIAASAVMGAVAVVWGIVAESRVLLFDGVFLLLGIVLSGVSLVASTAASSAPTRDFPFGKRAAVPMAIGLQGAALAGTVLYAMTDAVTIIRGGGTDVAPGVVLVYGLVSAAASVVVGWRLPKLSGTDLITAEVAQWRAGALLSAVIAAGGVIAVVLDGTSWSAAVAYADPVLVLIACILTIPVPVRLIQTSGRELLEAAPPPAVQSAIAEAVNHASRDFGLPVPTVAAAKLGQRLYLDVVFVVAGDWRVCDEDEVRHAIVDRLAGLGYDLWANVELTGDADLAG